MSWCCASHLLPKARECISSLPCTSAESERFPPPILAILHMMHLLYALFEYLQQYCNQADACASLGVSSLWSESYLGVIGGAEHVYKCGVSYGDLGRGGDCEGPRLAVHDLVAHEVHRIVAAHRTGSALSTQNARALCRCDWSCRECMSAESRGELPVLNVHANPRCKEKTDNLCMNARHMEAPLSTPPIFTEKQFEAIWSWKLRRPA